MESVYEADSYRLRLTRLANSTNATFPRLSRVVNSLERKGLVTRAPCEDNARTTDMANTGERNPPTVAISLRAIGKPDVGYGDD